MSNDPNTLLRSRWPELFAAGRIGMQDPHKPFSCDPPEPKGSTVEILAQRARRKREQQEAILSDYAHGQH